jgi:hypothetical protein
MWAIGAVWAGTSPGDDFFGLTAGMTLTGIGWCFGVIAASGLLHRFVPGSSTCQRSRCWGSVYGRIWCAIGNCRWDDRGRLELSKL